MNMLTVTCRSNIEIFTFNHGTCLKVTSVTVTIPLQLAVSAFSMFVFLFLFANKQTYTANRHIYARHIHHIWWIHNEMKTTTLSPSGLWPLTKYWRLLHTVNSYSCYSQCISNTDMICIIIEIYKSLVFYWQAFMCLQYLAYLVNVYVANKHNRRLGR